MKIVDFEEKHIDEAQKLALANYCEERQLVRELPEISDIPELIRFSENGLGVAVSVVRRIDEGVLRKKD